jgi:LuxR family maltose regulon positive regulatory protein
LPQVLLAVKIFLPPPNPEWIERPGLHERLEAALSHRVILLSAPAGFGKSSALSAWIDRKRRQEPAQACAWLALDEADNDPVRFWTYLCAAVQAALELTPPAGPPFGAQAMAQLRASGSEQLGETLDFILNELAGLPHGLILTLDDYHRITSRTVHEGLAYLAERMPPHMRLVLATRADPPLPLARWRARGELAEIRASGLRFNPAEIAVFFENSTGLQLDEDDLHTLARRTEGWAASLQMAALALKSLLEEQSASPGPADVDATNLARQMIASFSGQHAYVLDYFLEEVLNHQPPDLQDFLLRTSVLEKMSAGLCEALPGVKNAQSMLEATLKANLFLVPLDARRTWFRYHHLFSELLRARLNELHPGLAADLHAAAAAWYEPHEMIEEALYHRLAARDTQGAARLIETHWRRPVEAGEYDTAIEWFQALPPALMRARPRLALSFCWVLWLRGQIDRLGEWLDAAEAAMADSSGRDALDEIYDQGQAAVMRAVVLRFHGAVLASAEFARKAVRLSESLPPATNAQQAVWGALLRGVSQFHLAESLRMLNEVENAIAAYEAAIAQLAPYSPVAVSGSYYQVCALRSQQGRLRQAGEAASRGLAYARGFPTPNLPAFAWINIAAAEIAWERGEGTRADALLAEGETMGRGNLNALRYAASLRLRQMRGLREVFRADDLLEPLERLFRRANLNYLLEEVDALRALAALSKGDIEQAAVWARKAALHPQSGRDYPRLRLEIPIYARLLLAQGQPGQAAGVLGDALDQARAAGCAGDELGLLILRALARKTSGNASDDLVRALEMAAPEGYRRIFLDEGPAMRELLAGLATSPALRRLTPAARAWLDGLLADFSLVSEVGSDAPALPEPLTEREMEVLRLLAAGLSNRDMAEKLVLSEGTVKTHMHNLLGKLGAKNRGQVVAKARELGVF